MDVEKVSRPMTTVSRPRPFTGVEKLALVALFLVLAAGVWYYTQSRAA